MDPVASARVTEARDRLRLRLDILAEYDRVLREQLAALEAEDLERFSSLAEERELLGNQLIAVDEAAGADELTQAAAEALADDMETARLMAEIHVRANELRALDVRVLGVLESQRADVKREIDRTSAPVSDAAVRYMAAESGPGGDRLDVTL